jgi:hypothetical protein
MKASPATLYTLLAKQKLKQKWKRKGDREEALKPCESETVQQNEELIKSKLKVTALLAMSVKPGCFHQGNCKHVVQNNLHMTSYMVAKKSSH